MNKRVYESPYISKETLEVEGEFMCASVFEPQERAKGVTVKGHEISDEVGFSEDSFNDNKWD